jgi:hypothetical protein
MGPPNEVEPSRRKIQKILPGEAGCRSETFASDMGGVEGFLFARRVIERNP